MAMLADQPVMAFVTTTDLAKGRPFYKNILGLTVRTADDYGINFFGSGDKYLRMSVIRGFKAAPYAVLSWIVQDIKSIMTSLREKGVLFEIYEVLRQDVNGILWLRQTEQK